MEKVKTLLFSVTAKDLEWDYRRGSGKGGQKKNKTSSAVRCTHRESGAVGNAEDGRSQSQNKKLAFLRMTTTKEFQTWVKLKATGKLDLERKIEEAVEEAMRPPNIKIEIIDGDNKWVESDIPMEE